MEQFVLDLRRNGGGNNATYGPLISLMPRVQRTLPGQVYVITSP